MIKKITLEKIYSAFTGFCIVIYCYFMMIGMNESEVSQGKVVIPTFILFSSKNSKQQTFWCVSF